MHKIVKIVLNKNVRALCVKEYPGHPKGCPNFNKKQICPPKVGLFDKEFDIEQPIFAIWNIFDLGAHVANLKSKHPEWSDN